MCPDGTTGGNCSPCLQAKLNGAPNDYLQCAAEPPKSTWLVSASAPTLHRVDHVGSGGFPPIGITSAKGDIHENRIKVSSEWNDCGLSFHV